MGGGMVCVCVGCWVVPSRRGGIEERFVKRHSEKDGRVCERGRLQKKGSHVKPPFHRPRPPPPPPLPPASELVWLVRLRKTKDEKDSREGGERSHDLSAPAPAALVGVVGLGDGWRCCWCWCCWRREVPGSPLKILTVPRTNRGKGHEGGQKVRRKEIGTGEERRTH